MAQSVSDPDVATAHRGPGVWRPQAWYLAPVSVIVASFSLFGRPDFAHSAIWAVDAALTAIYVLWPITLGASAVPVIRLRRTASRELLEALPTGAQWRALVASAAWPGIWVSAGLVLSSVLALGVAAGHGSPPSWRAVAPLVPAVAGTVAMSALGGTCAVLVPRWFLPPLLTVASFAFLIYDIAGLRALTDFVGATGGVIVAMQLQMAVILGLCAGFAALVLASLAVSAADTTGLRRWWLIAVMAGAASIFILGSVDLRTPRTWTDDARWPCVPVPATAAEVCLPPDQRAIADAVSAALTPVATGLMQLDPTLSTARFSPSAAAVTGERPTVWITLPVGRPEAAADEVVPAVTDGLAVCWDADTAESEELTMASAMVVLQWWLAPELVPDEALLEAYGIAGRSPTDREAQQAYAVLTKCGR